LHKGAGTSIRLRIWSDVRIVLGTTCEIKPGISRATGFGRWRTAVGTQWVPRARSSCHHWTGRESANPLKWARSGPASNPSSGRQATAIASKLIGEATGHQECAFAGIAGLSKAWLSGLRCGVMKNFVLSVAGGVWSRQGSRARILGFFPALGSGAGRFGGMQAISLLCRWSGEEAQHPGFHSSRRACQ